MKYKTMISQALFWRTFIKDRIFLFLFILTVLTFLAALVRRQSDIETNAIPFELGLLFFCTNLVFALISLRREPLLSYMFLTATILLNGTLYFFFHYLLSIHLG